MGIPRWTDREKVSKADSDSILPSLYARATAISVSQNLLFPGISETALIRKKTIPIMMIHKMLT